ncbi:AbrB/MazE/SpoVT family DNA-binding domain-containing protein [Paenibacillus sp. CMAA1739]|uniref:AbrB/MazE/SpoVT family DNA-binding domain-containing protein n=1 Tax=Paenibacillus ottowii TaxID=2315729 RepID=UPI0027305FF3|nr:MULTISPECIES: AbrB/MazE/SpoVT family DNA-binding domain-containing protein [Paenibacillus]MDP1512628.1 AbrB/MazE/SpoVT family DNA-binding domain-containing protein [Paenibacillus ottowii]MEC4568613.1 AbrB/MazE/SpoVT family DNA-binding domain-containing protein [Paenibacillus sp. CMAA1739]
MKSTGMTRPLDALGRIVIPKEMRISMDFNVGDPVEIFADEETGILAFRKYTGVTCKMCGSAEQLTYFRDSFICKECIESLKKGVNFSPIQRSSKSALANGQRPIKESKRLRRSTKQMIESLKELMQKQPNAAQHEYAKILEVSQARISQLKKML